MLGVSPDTGHRTPDHGSSETSDTGCFGLVEVVAGLVRPCCIASAHGSAADFGVTLGVFDCVASTAAHGSSSQVLLPGMAGCSLMWFGPLVTA